MSRYDDYLHEVGKIEAATFSDAWSEQSIKDSLQQEYNTLFVVICDDTGVFFEIYQTGKKIYETYYKQNNNSDYKFVGYLISSQIAGESELLRIAIDEHYQGTGLGSKLLEMYIKHISESCEKAFLEVRDSNHAARSLYEKYGYVKIATRKLYYSNPPEDGIIYEYVPKNTK